MSDKERTLRFIRPAVQTVVIDMTLIAEAGAAFSRHTPARPAVVA